MSHNTTSLTDFWFDTTGHHIVGNSNTIHIPPFVEYTTPKDVDTQISYKMRNYVRKERFLDMEQATSKTFLMLMDQIESLTKRVNELYYPMRKNEEN